MSETSERDGKTQEIINSARQVDGDTEDMLSRMRRIKKHEIPALEQEYEALRDQLVETMDGPRLFIDDNEGKLVGFVVRPDKTILNEDVLSELSEAVVEEIAPRKINRTLLAAAVAGKRLTQSQVARILTIKVGAGTPHIRFIEVDAKGKDED